MNLKKKQNQSSVQQKKFLRTVRTKWLLQVFGEVVRSQHESQLIYFDEVWQHNKGEKIERIRWRERTWRPTVTFGGKPTEASGSPSKQHISSRKLHANVCKERGRKGGFIRWKVLFLGYFMAKKDDGYESSNRNDSKKRGWIADERPVTGHMPNSVYSFHYRLSQSHLIELQKY